MAEHSELLLDDLSKSAFLRRFEEARRSKLVQESRLVTF